MQSYMLNEHKNVIAADPDSPEYRSFLHGGFDRLVVSQEHVTIGVETYFVSTVFQEFDSNFFGKRNGTPPEFFETAIRKGAEWDVIQRYETWGQALTGHQRIVEALMCGSLSYEGLNA